MGSLFGGSKTTTTTKTPWAPQANQLTNAFTQAQDLYNQKSDSPWYQGELYAQTDPLTQQAVGATGTFVNGQGSTNASNLTSAGTSLLDPTAYQGALSAYSTAAGTDPTQQNITDASAYASNPYLDGQIDAASRDITRNLYENQLPGINSAASGSGNINSTRAGVADGIAMRGAQDQIGDIAATMRGNAYDQGLQLAQIANATNLNAMGNAAGLYGNSVSQGGNLVNSGNAMTLGNINAESNAGQINQQNQQGIDNANYQSWQGNDTRQQQLLQNYYNIIGANNWGGTDTSTQTQSPSILGSALGLASTISGMGGIKGIYNSILGQ